MSITNHSHRARSIDLTSYAEVVLAPAAADLAHPAFSNLFIETTAVPEWDALLCTRRPRAGTDRVYLIHVLSGRGRIGAATEYETDRARFIGRGRHAGQSHRHQRRRPALEYDRRRPRSDRQPPPVDSPPARRHGTDVVHHRVCRQRNERPTSHREVLRPPGGRARDRPGQHARADRAAPPRPHRRGHAAVPAARGPAALWRSSPAIAGRRPEEPSRTVGAVEVRHLGRPPHRARDHRRRQPAPAPLRPAQGPRVSARQGPGVRPRRAERARHHLPDGSAGRRAAHGRERSRAGVDRSPGRRLHAPGRPHARRGSAAAARRGTRRDGRRRRSSEPAARPTRSHLRAACRAADGPELPKPEPAQAVPPPAAPPELESFNGLGGFADNGREYVIRLHPNAGADSAGAMGQRRRAPDVRVCRVRPRHRVHVVREQPRQPADALVQRSGERSAGRGGLPSRRRQRPRVVGNAAARRRRSAVHDPARTGLQRLRARARRDRVAPARVRRRGGTGQGVPDCAAQHVQTPSATVGDDLRRVGPRREPRAHRTAHRHPPRADDGRAARVECLSRRVCATASRSWISSAASAAR